jgi:hypothetical protein
MQVPPLWHGLMAHSSTLMLHMVSEEHYGQTLRLTPNTTHIFTTTVFAWLSTIRRITTGTAQESQCEYQKY